MCACVHLCAFRTDWLQAWHYPCKGCAAPVSNPGSQSPSSHPPPLTSRAPAELLLRPGPPSLTAVPPVPCTLSATPPNSTLHHYFSPVPQHIDWKQDLLASSLSPTSLLPTSSSAYLLWLKTRLLCFTPAPDSPLFLTSSSACASSLGHPKVGSWSGAVPAHAGRTDVS